MIKAIFRKLFKVIICITFIAQLSYPGFSQIIIEDADGKDLLQRLSAAYNGGIVFKVNPKNDSIKLIADLHAGNSESPKFHSFEWKGQASNGIVDMVKNKKINPGLSFAYRYTQTHFLVEKENVIDWFSLKVGYEFAQYSMFNAEAQYKDQITKEKFNGPSVNLNWSLLINGAHVLSLTAGYLKTNNYKDLTKVEIDEIEEGRIFENPETNAKRVVKKTQTAREGNYIEFGSFPFKAVYAYLPDEDRTKVNKLLPGWAIYVTRHLNSKIQDTSKLGLNLYITKADKKTGVRSPMIAIFVETGDIFNEKKSDKSFKDRIVIGFTLNFSLFKF